MNKRNIFKNILILLAIIFILNFQFQIENIGFFVLIPVLILITNYMYKYKDKITKHKFIYDVILIILILLSALVLAFVFVNIPNLISVINIEPIVIFIFGGLYLMFKIFVDGIVTMKQPTDKVNDYMTIVTFSIINLIFVRYYFNICNVIVATIDQAYFIRQNYIYFFIMFLVIEIHKYINNKFLRMN